MPDENARRFVDFRFGVRRGDGEADAAGAFRHRRRADGGEEEPVRAARGGEGDGFLRITHDDGQDGRRPGEERQARCLEGHAEAGGIPAEAGEVRLRRRFEQAERGEGGGRRGGPDGRGEDEGPGPVPEPFDDGPGGAHEAPFRAEGLAEGAHLQIDDAGHVPVFGGAPAGLPDDAGGVGVVHEEARTVRMGELRQRGKIGHVAVHAEYAVGRDVPLACTGRLREEPREGGHVAVRVDGHAGAADAAPVDEAGVVQAVAEDDVVPVCEAVEDAQIRHVSRIEDERRLIAFEAGQLRLEVGQLEGRAGGKPRAAGACAPPEGVPRRRDDRRLVGHAEVVVRVEDEAG